MLHGSKLHPIILLRTKSVTFLRFANRVSQPRDEKPNVVHGLSRSDQHRCVSPDCVRTEPFFYDCNLILRESWTRRRLSKEPVNTQHGDRLDQYPWPRGSIFRHNNCRCCCDCHLLRGENVYRFDTFKEVSPRLLAAVVFFGKSHTLAVRVAEGLLAKRCPQIICAASQTTFCMAVTFGLGAHEDNLDPPDIITALRTAWISQISGLIAIVTGKLSIVKFLDQIRGRHRGRPWFLYSVGVSTIIVNVVMAVLPFFQCTPVNKLWDENLPGDCHVRSFAQAYAYFQGCKSPLPFNCDLGHGSFHR